MNNFFIVSIGGHDIYFNLNTIVGFTIHNQNSNDVMVTVRFLDGSGNTFDGKDATNLLRFIENQPVLGVAEFMASTEDD
jgi:hypothetical protein